MTFEEFIGIVSTAFGELTDTQIEQYRRMDALYRDWNSKINVISRKDIDELYSHHVLHSLAVAEYMKMKMPEAYDALRDPSGNISVLDLGTGGGFPGIPLAILFPGGKFTLCDSVGKKIKVTSAVAEALGLENVTTVNARAESITQKFDYIVSRAVTSIENLNTPAASFISKAAISPKNSESRCRNTAFHPGKCTHGKWTRGCTTSISQARWSYSSKENEFSGNFICI